MATGCPIRPSDVSDMLELIAACKQYRRRETLVHALHPITLSIDKGEYVALIGPSGSGKTTLLTLLGGMLAPTSGEVVFEGRSLYGLSVTERARVRNERIGFVFQQFNLVPWLTALENVQLPLCLYGTESPMQKSRALALLERFGLAERADHRPSELSAGQQQRVALARTLVTDPGLILADEPTGNLDPESRRLVLETFRDMHAEGRTIVLVTHDPVVSAAAGRVLQLNAGRVSEGLTTLSAEPVPPDADAA